jgi:Ser/Thr protein kinase RdoA (MazF antagonist)
VSVANEQFWGCVFQAIDGDVFDYERSPSPEKHFWRVGRALGKIHTVSRVFAPTGATRFSWIEDRTLADVDEYLPASERAVRDKLEDLLEWAKAQPRGRDRYGLIHGDFGAPNYRVEGDSIYAFDFDDCCQHWFAYDLAIALYPHGWREGARKLLDRLLEGYAESMDVCVEPEQIERFCELREAYMFLHQMRKQHGVPSERYTSEWFERKRAAIARGYRIND